MGEPSTKELEMGRHTTEAEKQRTARAKLNQRTILGAAGILVAGLAGGGAGGTYLARDGDSKKLAAIAEDMAAFRHELVAMKAEVADAKFDAARALTESSALRKYMAEELRDITRATTDTARLVAILADRSDRSEREKR